MVRHNDGEPYEVTFATGSTTLVLENLTPGPHSFIVEAFDAAGNSRVATMSFVVEAFSAPVWTDYPTQVNQSVIPVLIGTTRPNAEVIVSISPLERGLQGALTTEYRVVANGEGTFRVIPDGRLQQGVYEITAYAIDTAGAQSAPTEAIRLVVAPSGVIRIGQWLVSVLSVLVPLIALIVLLALIILYGIIRMRRVRQYVIAETADALAVVEKHFTNLKQALNEDVQVLQKSRKAKKLTKAEAALVDDVQARINAAEAAIRKEISEVDDIVST